MRTVPKNQQTDLVLCLAPHHPPYRRMYRTLREGRNQLRVIATRHKKWLTDEGTTSEQQQKKTPDSSEPSSSLQR